VSDQLSTVIMLVSRSVNWSGVTLALPFALDLIYDIIFGWKSLFQCIAPFQKLLQTGICPAIRPLLKCLQEDFVFTAGRNGVASAAGLTSRVVRVARCLLLDFVAPAGLMDEMDTLITLMVHSLQPNRGGGASIGIGMGIGFLDHGPSSGQGDYFGGGGGGGGGGIGNAAGVVLSMLNGGNKNPNAVPLSNSSASSQPRGCGVVLSGPSCLHLAPCYSNQTNRMSGAGGSAGAGGGSNVDKGDRDRNNAQQIPAHPAGVCLEALLSFFLSSVPNELARSGRLPALGRAMTTTLVSVSSVLICGFSVDSNCLDFETVVRGSQLITLVRH
jgi:hypothetical protein